MFFYVIYDQLVNGVQNYHLNKSVNNLNSPDYVENNAIFSQYNIDRTSSLE